MGDVVVLRSLDTPLKNGARVIVPGDRFRRYTIDRMEGAWVRLASTDIGGWVEREAIIALDRADEFFSNALMHDPRASAHLPLTSVDGAVGAGLRPARPSSAQGLRRS
jgi:hypothetical protein